MTFLSVILALLMSCGEDDGTGMKPNPFEDDPNGPLLKVEYSSNADSVFLSWELLNN